MHKSFIKITLAVVFLLWFMNTLNAQIFTFRSVTFLGEVRDLVFTSGKVWGATGGGLIAFNVSDQTFEEFNNIEGLSSINISSLALDDQNQLWLGMDDGSLNVVDISNNNIRRVQIDTEPIVINDLVVQGNDIYLATDIGISLFTIDKEEINSTFRTLGQFAQNTEVGKLFIFSGQLWAATQFGIAIADLNAPNLQDPQFWKNYTTADGLPGNALLDFAELNGVLYVATSNGVFRFVGNRFENDGLSFDAVHALQTIGGVFYAAADDGFYRRDVNGLWILSQPNLTRSRSIVGDENGVIWVGHRDNGLYSIGDGDAAWTNFAPSGPKGDTFEDMVIDGKRRLWAATGLTSGKGIHMFDGVTWRTFNTSSRDSLTFNTTTGIAEDGLGRIWTGTPGRGAMIIETTDTDRIIVTRIDTVNGRLTGSDTPNFVIVNRMHRDASGNLWLVNKFANTGRALIAVSPENQWEYFSTGVPGSGISSAVINNFGFDIFGRVWIATENNGVTMLDHKGTLGNRSDDFWKNYTESSGLRSNRVRAVAGDRELGVWIGTEEGINHIIDGLDVRVIRGALDNFINAIAVDPANNKWFGTPSGISILASDDFTWTHITKENSKLLDNNIISILFDDENGDAYIGTGKGLSIIGTPNRTPETNFSKISVFPNPFMPDNSGVKLTIENLLIGSEVKIFTASGRLVRALTVDNGGVTGTQAFWDGRDESGNKAPTGIYVILAGSRSETGTYKFAVINK